MLLSKIETINFLTLTGNNISVIIVAINKT